jgi:thiol-disulfide isomerase/thioredoxin
MKKSFPFLLVLLALAAHVASAQSGRSVTTQPAQTEPQTETHAPAVAAPTPDAPAAAKTLPESVLNRELQSLDKGSFRLADFSGKVFVINLWATWCGPCRREIPEYEVVRKAYAARGVEFIALTPEDPKEDAERVRKFVRELNFGFRIGWLDRQTANTLMNGRSLLPQTFIIAADGHIVRHFRGYAPGRGAAIVRESLDSALK